MPRGVKKEVTEKTEDKKVVTGPAPDKIVTTPVVIEPEEPKFVPPVYSNIEAIKKASQGNEEMVAVLTEVAKISPKNILEIGVDKGYSMQVWAEAFKPDVLMGIDSNIAAIECEAGHGLVIEGDSHDPKIQKIVKDHMPDGIDFLFIDGDHGYEGVKADFIDYGIGMVRKGGIIALHDSEITDIEGVEIHEFLKKDFNDKVNADWKIIHKDGSGTALLVKQ